MKSPVYFDDWTEISNKNVIFYLCYFIYFIRHYSIFACLFSYAISTTKLHVV